MIGVITAALETIHEVVKRLPTYEQKKKDKFYRLRKELYEELKKPDHEKNDGRIGDLYADLRLFFDSFREEIKASGISIKNL